jgi:hypothetical protein
MSWAATAATKAVMATRLNFMVKEVVVVDGLMEVR